MRGRSTGKCDDGPDRAFGRYLWSPLRSGVPVDKGLARGTGHKVVAVLTGLDAYQATLAQGMTRVLAEHGYSLIVHVHSLIGTDLPLLECLLTHRSASGMITTPGMSAVQDALLRRLAADSGVPAVHIAGNLPGETCVRADNTQGMGLLMAHLLDEHGARRPGLVRGASHHNDHLEREQVFRAAMAERGLAVDEDLIIDGGLEQGAYFHRVRSLLRSRDDFDALVTMDDWSAVAVVTALGEAGLAVPDQVAVTGFDNYPMATLSWPGITTVDQNLLDQGALAATA